MLQLKSGARKLLSAAGADVDQQDMMVRFDRGLVMEQLALAPRETTLHARNPSRNFTLGGNHIAFTSVGGPAYCSDLDRGRRRGSFADVCDYLKLVQSLDIIHQEGGGPFETLELPAETRHLDLYHAQIRLLDKNWQPIALGRDRARDAINMAAMGLGISTDELAVRPALFAIINTNSPRPAGSWHAATICPSVPATRPRPTASTRRRPTRAPCPCGPPLVATPTSLFTRLAGWKAD